MTRLTDTSFAGVKIHDATKGKLLKKTTVETIAKDQGYIWDLLTGATGDLNGDGSADGGALPGFPICNEIMPSQAGDGGLFPKENTAVFAGVIPFHTPPGETEAYFRIGQYNEGMRLDNKPEVRIYNTSWSLVETVELSQSAPWSGSASSLTADTTYFAGLYIETETEETEMRITGFAINFNRKRGSLEIAEPDLPSGFTDEASLSTQTLGTTDVSPDITDLDDSLIASDYAVPGYLIYHLSTNLNTMTEYVTGLRHSGNKALTLTDEGATDPTQSAFWDHSRAGSYKTSENILHVPIWSESNGPIAADTTTIGAPYTTGRTGCTFLTAGSTLVTMAEFCAIIPATKNAHNDNNLNVAILLKTTVATGDLDFRIEIDNSSGTTIGRETSFTINKPSGNWCTAIVSGNINAASGSGDAFPCDEPVHVRIEVGSRGATGASALRYVGAAIWIAGS